MGTDLLHALYHHLDQEPALVRAGMSLPMQRMVQAIHSDTHFFLKGQTDHCKTGLGTRPGDSWADIIFSFLWSRLLRDLEGDLHQLGIIEAVPDEQGLRNPKLPCTLETPPPVASINFLGPTWMDDSVLCFADSSAELLEQKAGQLCGLLLQKCNEFAMTPNLALARRQSC